MGLDDEIASFPERKMDFIRWICVQIALTDLPFIKEPLQSRYTRESNQLIVNFIAYAVERFNASHGQQLDVNKTAQIISQWWHDDIAILQNDMKGIEH